MASSPPVSQVNPYLTSTTPSASSLLARARDDGGVRQVSEEFEAVFMSTMLSQMFAGVPTDGPFGGGQGEEMFRSLLIEEYGSTIAKSGGIGLADDIARDLLALQETTRDQ